MYSWLYICTCTLVVIQGYNLGDKDNGMAKQTFQNHCMALLYLYLLAAKRQKPLFYQDNIYWACQWPLLFFIMLPFEEEGYIVLLMLVGQSVCR